MAWLDNLKDEVLKWRVEIYFDHEDIGNKLLRFLDNDDGIETTATVLPDEEQKLIGVRDERSE